MGFGTLFQNCPSTDASLLFCWGWGEVGCWYTRMWGVGTQTMWGVGTQTMRGVGTQMMRAVGTQFSISFPFYCYNVLVHHPTIGFLSCNTVSAVTSLTCRHRNLSSLATSDIQFQHPFISIYRATPLPPPPPTPTPPCA